MAWTYEQKFNDLNTGDLNGQDSWNDTPSSGTSVSVVESNTYEGAKCAFATALVKSYRQISAVTSGVFYVSLMHTTSTGGIHGMVIMSSSYSVAFQFYMRVESPNDWYCIDGASPVYIGSWTDNVYTRAGIEFDCSTDQWRINFDDGSWSSWFDFQNVQASVGAMRLWHNSIDDCYWDFISPNYADDAVAVDNAIAFGMNF